MSGLIAFPLHAASLNHLLQQSYSKGKEKRQLCVNLKAKVFKVFDETKRAFEIKKEGFRPFELKDVVIASRKLKIEFEADPQIAYELSPLLEKLSRDQASQRAKGCCLVRLIALVWECVNNFFKGLGFRSSAAAASKLARELKAIPSKKPLEEKKPEPKPSLSTADASSESLEEEKSQPEPLPTPIEFEGLVKQSATNITIPVNKRGRLQNYSGSVRKRLNGQNEPITQVTVSQVLHAAKSHLENQTDTSQCFFGLMRAVSNEEWYDPKTQKAYVNFSSPEVFQVICDLIVKSDSESIVGFFQKCKGYRTFNADGVKACLRGYIERSEAQNCDIVFLVEVLKYYRQFFDHKKLPPNDPAIVKAMSVLFAKAAAVESGATELLEWYTRDPSYGYESAIILIVAFKNAERSFVGESANLGYVVRIFNDELKERLKTEHQELYDLLYPPPKEVKPYEPPPSVSTLVGRNKAQYASMRLKRQQSQILTPVVEKFEVKVPRNKLAWLKAYSEQVDAALRGDKIEELPRSVKNLFRDLHSNPDHDNPNDSSHSLAGLILTLSGAKMVDIQDPKTPITYINFEDPKAIQILMDVLQHGTAEQIRGLWDWVSENPAFGVNAIKKCLEVLPTHCAQKNLSFFLECFKRYQKEHVKFANILPVPHPTITEALKKITSVGALETTELVNWHNGYFTDHKFHFSEAQLKDVPGLVKLLHERPEYADKLIFTDETSVYQAKKIELAYREQYKKKCSWYLKYDEQGRTLASKEECEVIFQFTNHPGLSKEELDAQEKSIVENWKLHMQSLVLLATSDPD